MTDILSLEQLVHLSLGDPEAGAVNFNVLKTLLLQMLKAMNLYNYKPTMSDDDQRTLTEALSTSSEQHVKFEQDESLATSDNGNEIKRKSQRKKRDRSSDRLNTLEEKVFRFESQLNALDHLPSNSEVIDRAKQMPKRPSNNDDPTKTTDSQGPILEIWQYTQMEKRIESAENGITRLASLLQDLLSDMNDLKESNETIKQTTDEFKNTIDMLNKDKNDWAKKSDIESLEEKLRNLENLLSSLRDHLNGSSKENNNIISMPDLTGFVTWDQLQDALSGIRESIEKSSHNATATSALERNTPSPVQLVEQQSQTSAKRKESSSGGINYVPSNISEQLGELNDRYEQLRVLVEALEENKLNREEFDAFKNQQNDVFNRLATLEKDIDDLRSQRTSGTSDPAPAHEIIKEGHAQPRTDSSDFRTALKRLREELDRLKQLIQDLINKENLSAQDIDASKKLIQQLDQTKADKSYVNSELDKKADKRDIDNRVLKKEFNTACNDLSQNINDCLQKFHLHDDLQKKDLQKINHDIDGKLDRTELDALRDYMEKQMKKLKKLTKEQQQPQQQHVHVMSEDEAAGLRKQLIRFHCISCDRPIDVQPHPQQPSLPVNQAMRPMQSPRPYTTYELDQIRQFQKSQQFSNEFTGSTTDVYATIRQCGGSHTTTLPFKRQIKTQPAVPEEAVLVRNEVDIKGQDGVIYKGRLNADKLPSLDIHKKNSIVLLAPPPFQRPRSDSHPLTTPSQHQRELSEFKRVLTIEQQILTDSETFSLTTKERHFKIETIFDWNEMNITDILEINKVNLNDLLERWKKSICKKRSCHHQIEIQQNREEDENVKKQVDIIPLGEIEKKESDENLDHIPSLYEYNSEVHLDSIPHHQSMDNIELSSSSSSNTKQTETPSQDNHIVCYDESTMLNSIITNLLNDRITTETLAENNPLSSDKNSRRSLFKLDKTTSMHSLLPMSNEHTNIFSDFFTDLFIFEKPTSRNPNLGKHEHWIANATASYIHPFNDYSHKTYKNTSHSFFNN